MIFLRGGAFLKKSPSPHPSPKTFTKGLLDESFYFVRDLKRLLVHETERENILYP